MMPFPPVSELPTFTGGEIAQVWLDPWGLRFLFDSEVQLYIEYRMEHIEADGTAWLYDAQAETKSPLVLHRLLYKKIISFSRDDLCLIFGFENGDRLSVYSDTGQYESGNITTPAGTFTVF